MQIALFSDVHGNLTALREVWAAIEQDGGFDAVVCAGDLAAMRPHPDECIQFLREHGVQCVLGNTDLFFISERRPTPEAVQRLPFLLNQAEWCNDHISESSRDFIRALPMTLRFGAPPNELLVCHATPHDLWAPCLPQAPDEQWAQAMGPLDAAAIAFGHVHVPSQRLIGGKLYINVAHCGLGLAEYVGYTILSYAAGRWQAERRPVAHDAAAEQAYARAIGFPGADEDTGF